MTTEKMKIISVAKLPKTASPAFAGAMPVAIEDHEYSVYCDRIAADYTEYYFVKYRFIGDPRETELTSFPKMKMVFDRVWLVEPEDHDGWAEGKTADTWADILWQLVEVAEKED